MKRRPDEFYVQVADLYRWHGATGAAAFVAGLYDVPKSTVQGWFRLARQRGLLGPGQRAIGKSCRTCGQPMDERAIEFERKRRARWARDT
jgi:transposase-like protein